MLKLALLVLAVALAVQACSPVLSCSQMQALVKANFPSQYQTDMLCIAYYESSWCPGVYNGTLRCQDRVSPTLHRQTRDSSGTQPNPDQQASAATASGRSTRTVRSWLVDPPL